MTRSLSIPITNISFSMHDDVSLYLIFFFSQNRIQNIDKVLTFTNEILLFGNQEEVLRLFDEFELQLGLHTLALKFWFGVPNVIEESFLSACVAWDKLTDVWHHVS